MYIKEIKYEDYNGNEVKEKFYFNLNQSEITTMNMEQEGGLNEYINRIINTRDSKELISLFKTLILKSYGEKSDDGKHFYKTINGRNLAEEFMQTEAYNVFFMELASDEKAVADFINGIIPKKMRDQLEAEAKKNGGNVSALPNN